MAVYPCALRHRLYKHPTSFLVSPWEVISTLNSLQSNPTTPAHTDLDGHELNGSVPLCLDTRQHVVTELRVCADALILTTHAHMRLVDAQAGGATGSLVAPAVVSQCVWIGQGRGGDGWQAGGLPSSGSGGKIIMR